jgi:hypothetical protein
LIVFTKPADRRADEEERADVFERLDRLGRRQIVDVLARGATIVVTRQRRLVRQRQRGDDRDVEERGALAEHGEQAETVRLVGVDHDALGLLEKLDQLGQRDALRVVARHVAEKVGVRRLVRKSWGRRRVGDDGKFEHVGEQRDDDRLGRIGWTDDDLGAAVLDAERTLERSALRALGRHVEERDVDVGFALNHDSGSSPDDWLRAFSSAFGTAPKKKKKKKKKKIKKKMR